MHNPDKLRSRLHRHHLYNLLDGLGKRPDHLWLHNGILRHRLRSRLHRHHLYNQLGGLGKRLHNGILRHSLDHLRLMNHLWLLHLGNLKRSRLLLRVE